MNAIELAEYFENDADGSVSDSEVAYLLRRQHEAIVKLRESLRNIQSRSSLDSYVNEVAKYALKKTEDF